MLRNASRTATTVFGAMKHAARQQTPAERTTVPKETAITQATRAERTAIGFGLNPSLAQKTTVAPGSHVREISALRVQQLLPRYLLLRETLANRIVDLLLTAMTDLRKLATILRGQIVYSVTLPIRQIVPLQAVNLLLPLPPHPLLLLRGLPRRLLDRPVLLQEQHQPLLRE